MVGTRRIEATLAVAVGLLWACGPETTDEGLGTIAGIETSIAGIGSFVRDRGYAAWTSEPAVHESAGPHGQVKVFFNGPLEGSLTSTSASHPKESVSVKELYEDDGQTLDGFAVMIKVADGTGASTWLWWEGFLPDLDAVAYGRGIDQCNDCHESGQDRVVSLLPR